MDAETIKRWFPFASASCLEANKTDTPLPNPKPSKQARALAGNDEGKTQGAGCPLVRFTLRRVRLLDVDAKYGSIKDLLDSCAYAGLIPGDQEGQINLEVRQEKVRHFKEEETEIVIEYP
jgi:hypothetical protein